jgi:hypothetical protein
MAYSKQQNVKIEDYPSNDGFVPDKSFVKAWEEYLADEDLEEEMEAFRCTRGRFMDLVVKGPLATEWMRQQAHWYLWVAEQEDELSHSHSQSPSLSYDYKEVMSPSLSHEEVEDSEELKMPGEAEEYAEDVESWGAVSAQGETQEDWDAFYASQHALYSEDFEEDGEAPDEAIEYVEDPTVLEEDNWAAFCSR